MLLMDVGDGIWCNTRCCCLRDCLGSAGAASVFWLCALAVSQVCSDVHLS